MALLRNTGLLHATDNALRGPDYVDTAVLIASTTLSSAAQVFTPPAGAAFVNFNSTYPFYVGWGTSAVAIPTSTGSITGGATYEMINPVTEGSVMRNIGSTALTTAVSLIATGAGPITMAWYKV